MTAFLLKTFIPGYDKREDSAVRSSIGALSGGVGIAVNILLFLVKLLAGIPSVTSCFHASSAPGVFPK